MFKAQGGLLLERDHLDVSFTATDRWPSVPGMGIASVWMLLGDRLCGPAVGLTATGPIPQDFRIPAHFHRSDAFHLSLRGELLMSADRLGPSEFRLQESGKSYDEGLGESADGVWSVLVVGDRRGEAGTFMNGETRSQVQELDLSATTPLIDELFPESTKGHAAIRTTVGACRGGFLSGSFSDAPGWQAAESCAIKAAVALGDVGRGPILYLVEGGPNELVQPACTYRTEQLWMTLAGSFNTSGSRYGPGEGRVQASGSSQEEVLSGPEGLQALVIVANRSHATPQLSGGDVPGSGLWLQQHLTLRSKVA
jgi:hypothetical protein